MLLIVDIGRGAGSRMAAACRCRMSGVAPPVLLMVRAWSRRLSWASGAAPRRHSELLTPLGSLPLLFARSPTFGGHPVNPLFRTAPNVSITCTSSSLRHFLKSRGFQARRALRPSRVNLLISAILEADFTRRGDVSPKI